MKLLEQKILSEGRALNEDVLLVDSFLNHQVDCALMDEVGREFARLFAADGVTRIVTIESSGIAPAAMTALHMKLPMVFMKKQASVIQTGNVLQTEVFSFTKQKSYQLTVKKQYIKPGGRAELVKAAGATFVGVGAVICKRFQPGYDALVKAGYHVEALAKVIEMGEGFVRFEA